jgi:predicted phosphoribosyltransferase
MEIWIAATVIGSVVAGLVLRRILAPASSEVDLGQVSQSWITEARTNKSEH